MKILKVTGNQTGLYCFTECGVKAWRSPLTAQKMRVYKVHVPGEQLQHVKVMFRYTSEFFEWLERRIGKFIMENDDEYHGCRGGSKFTEYHVENILYYHSQGWTTKQISETMTCSVGAVNQVLYADGKKPNKSTDNGTATDAEATGQAGLRERAASDGQCEMFSLKKEGGSVKSAESTQATDNEQNRKAA